MYITCVCLFSALSSRVGALQISIIIIINRTDFCSRAVRRGRFIATGNPSHAILLCVISNWRLYCVINVRQVLKFHFWKTTTLHISVLCLNSLCVHAFAWSEIFFSPPYVVPVWNSLIKHTLTSFIFKISPLQAILLTARARVYVCVRVRARVRIRVRVRTRGVEICRNTVHVIRVQTLPGNLAA